MLLSIWKHSRALKVFFSQTAPLEPQNFSADLGVQFALKPSHFFDTLYESIGIPIAFNTTWGFVP